MKDGGAQARGRSRDGGAALDLERGSLGLPRWHARWFGFCLASILFFVGLHALYLTSIAFPPQLTIAWGSLLFAELLVFFFPAVLLSAVAVPAVALLLALVLWPRTRAWCLRAHGGCEVGYSLHAWLHSVLWGVFLVTHAYFDLDPYLLLVWASGLVLSLSALPARSAVWLGLAVLWALLANDAAQRLAVAALSLGLLPALAYGSRLLARDRFTGIVGLLWVVQPFAALAPLALPNLHGGRLLEREMAYSFCEPPAGETLFASVRRCDIGGGSRASAAELLERCNGKIVEYDARTLTRRADHRFFSERFFGRFEGLMCLEETVQVGMDWTLVDGRLQPMSLLEFRIDDPSDYRTNVLGDASGNVMAWDRRHESVYYISEAHPLVRMDLRSRAIERELGVSAVAPRVGLTDIAVHEDRNSLFLMDHFGWIQEMDLTGRRIVDTYHYGHGWEFAIDEALDRVYISGTWGLEVLDLGTGRIVRRAWLGLGGRRPAVDVTHDRIYVPVEGAGKLQVFDRRSLRLLGSLPLGGGIRYPYVSPDGRWLLATNELAHFSWNAADLAQRLR